MPLGLIGAGKLVYDFIDKDFRVETNMIVVLGFAFALATLGLIADLMIQLNKRRHDVMPRALSEK